MTTFPSPEQAAVIDHPLAPLRVTAGAGSGKTGTMAARLARVVQEGLVAPEEALGITFTNKAAGELADRVRRALPDLAAEGREVEITTYHGFAHSLLREFGPLVGAPREVRIVTPGYTRQMIHDAIAEGPRPALDLTQPGTVVDRVARLAAALGDHLGAPSDLLSEGDDTVVAERNALAEILMAYQDRKRRLGVVDFADLVALAHRLVQAHRDVAARIRHRYRVVLLDEYQDTNPGQRELLRTIFDDGFPITAVGDTDQTIYEWRGASPHNFAAFGEHFPHGDGTPAATLDLSVTWRSDARIVAVANAVRAHLAEPGPLPRLLARPGAPDGEVVTHWAADGMSEARWIADRCLALHEDGVPWREMAVLFRKHRQMAMVRDALTERDIPVEVASLGGLLEVPEVVDLHAWLRVIGRPDDAVALVRLLLGSRVRLGIGDLGPLVRWVQRHSRHDDDETGIGWALLEAVDDLESVEGLRPEAHQRLASFRDLYRDLLTTAQGTSLVDLCRVVLDRTGAWSEVDALDDAARLSTRLNLYRFLDLAEDWSPLEGAPSLAAFLDHLDLLAGDGATDELDTARVSGEDAIPLLTVHRAKGLEWEAVFLPALAANIFPSGILQYDDPGTVASVLPEHLRLDAAWRTPLPVDPTERKAVLKERHADQEWRTAYVAVTRARRHLFASGSFWIGGARPRQPSELFTVIDELADRAEGRIDEPGERPEDPRRFRGAAAPDPVFAAGVTATLAAAVRDPGLPRRLATDMGLVDSYDAVVEQLRIEFLDLPEPGRVEPEPEPFTASVTGLVTLASCPLRYRWSEIERLPRRPSAAARRGVDLHRRIELHNRGSVAFDEAEPGFYDAVGDEAPPVASAMTLFRGSRFAGARPAIVEAPFTLIVGERRISGRIDAVYEWADGHWEVVDFKSGRASGDPARKVQLQVYAIAVAEAGFGGRFPDQIEVTFAYFGGGAVEEVTETVDEDWLTAARTEVAALMEQAAAAEHPARPGDGCRHCDFAHVCPAGREWLEVNR